MRLSVLMAVAILLLGLIVVFGDGRADRCSQVTSMAWTYCAAVQPAR